MITLDGDFHAILATKAWSFPSVIRVRRQGLAASEMSDLISRLIVDHAEALASGAVLSVRAHLVGIRRLPLSGPRDDDDVDG